MGPNNPVGNKLYGDALMGLRCARHQPQEVRMSRVLRSSRSRLALLAGALLVVGGAVPAIAGGQSATAATPTLDHFQCYSAQATKTAAAPAPFTAAPPAVLLKN